MVDREKELWDELVINAFVDGELDEKTRRSIEEAMVHDASLKTWILNRERLNGLLQGAYANVMNRPPQSGTV